jgi:hypothetical protein
MRDAAVVGEISFCCEFYEISFVIVRRFWREVNPFPFFDGFQKKFILIVKDLCFIRFPELADVITEFSICCVIFISLMIEVDDFVPFGVYLGDLLKSCELFIV